MTLPKTPETCLAALEKAIAAQDVAAASKAYLDLQMAGGELERSAAARREAAEAAYLALMEGAG